MRLISMIVVLVGVSFAGLLGGCQKTEGVSSGGEVALSEMGRDRGIVGHVVGAGHGMSAMLEQCR